MSEVYMNVGRWRNPCSHIFNLWLLCSILSPVWSFAQSIPSHGQEFSILSKARLLVGLSSNYPVYASTEHFRPSIAHPIVGIRYLADDWMVGLNVHYKFFQDIRDESKLSLWTLEEEFYYKVRLYHPLYVLPGFKFLYLYPTKLGTYPFRKREDQYIEVGVAVSMAFLYLFENSWGLGVFTDLWRGTGTTRFEGVELGVQILVPLRF